MVSLRREVEGEEKVEVFLEEVVWEMFAAFAVADSTWSWMKDMIYVGGAYQNETFITF